VGVPHSALVNFVSGAVEQYEITSSDRVLQFASVSFDTSAEEIYPGLTSGATLVLRSEMMLSTAAEFLSQCEEQGVTVLDLPTAYWHELTRALAAEQLRFPGSVRLVIIGGEKALPECLAMWQQRVGRGLRLVNTYGPTETTIVTTIGDISDAEADSARPVSLGRPIPNSEIYILDKELQPVPIGVTGSLYIGGEGVARGYINRPEVAAERFIPHFFSRQPGRRLYHTGDLARYRADSEIEYIGRSDDQVKVRGFRIELGEIQAALNQCEGVVSSVVVAHERAAGENQLLAYLVAENASGPSVTDLRRHLKQTLPDYMIPAAFINIDAIPKTPSGKLDKHSLPIPEDLRPELDISFVAPRTPIESELAQIWCELLKLDQVGVYDNFFDLGGHSLLLTRLASIIRHRLQVNLTIPALFNAPTIVAITEAIVLKQLEQESSDEIARMLEELQQLSSDEIKTQLTL